MTHKAVFTDRDKLLAYKIDNYSSWGEKIWIAFDGGRSDDSVIITYRLNEEGSIYILDMVSLEKEKEMFAGAQDCSCGTMPHPQAEVLKAIADGKEVQYQNRGTENNNGRWIGPSCIENFNPITNPENTWRVKPKTITKYQWLYQYPNKAMWYLTNKHYPSAECAQSSIIHATSNCMRLESSAKEFEC